MLIDTMTKNYIQLKDLDVYKLARQLSKLGWEIYNSLDWQTKKVIGDQFITATDSFGANVAEGYGRFHYLDRIKFLYNARGSLIEAAEHWIELLKERDKVDLKMHKSFKEIAEQSSLKLQNFISATYKAREASDT